MSAKIDSTIENWEDGKLGEDKKYAKPSDLKGGLIDKSLELQMISVRIQKSLLDDLKLIASYHGLGYQPLMKQILKRFVECEKKNVLREYAATKAKEHEEEGGIRLTEDETPPCDTKEAC